MSEGVMTYDVAEILYGDVSRLSRIVRWWDGTPLFRFRVC